MPPIVAAAAAAPALFTAGAAAAAGIGGALIGSHSAGSAAKTQAASADAALAEQKRIFDIQQAQRAPYLAASQEALERAKTMAAAGRNPALPAQVNRFAGGSLGAYAMPQQAQGPQGMPSPQMPAGLPAQVPTDGGMVMLEAPNGQRANVPANQVEAAIQRGARRVQ